MRLTHLKLAGFKSFVDPTTIEFKSNLTGVLGPNGCGKSNLIDAVRWVMGESSAKTLRGDLISDVIFNGSSTRKPLGQASVELIFDNGEGKLEGQYANYDQISIKRLVTRDGTSTYFLNGGKCRRKDIKDIFLGTGLGPRSYSIIEQGMISRLIEAKPQELRNFLEEAAGISKFKERRRETENRIKNTHENLARVGDIIGELEKQIERLQRQSKAAERYKTLKEDERTLKAEVAAIKYKALNEKFSVFETKIKANELRLSEYDAKHTSANKDLVQYKELHDDVDEDVNDIQRTLYQHNSEVVRLEEALLHQKSRKEELEREITKANLELSNAKGHLKEDEKESVMIKEEIDAIKPTLNELNTIASSSKSELSLVEDNISAWQKKWDAFNQSVSNLTQSASIEETKISQLEGQIAEVKSTLVLKEEELHQIDLSGLKVDIDALNEKIKTLTTSLLEKTAEKETLDGQLQSQNTSLQDKITLLDSVKAKHARAQGSFESLQKLQAEALQATEGGNLSTWLKAQNLEGSEQLAEVLNVSPGWEKATGLVLGNILKAYVVDDIKDFKHALTSLNGNVSLVSKTPRHSALSLKEAALAQHVNCEPGLQSYFDGVYAVDNLTEAYELLARIAPGERIVTQSGFLLNHDTLVALNTESSDTELLKRKKAIEALKNDLAHLKEEVKKSETEISVHKADIDALQEKIRLIDEGKTLLNVTKTDCATDLGITKNKLEILQKREAELKAEMTQSNHRLTEHTRNVIAAKEKFESATIEINALSKKRDALTQEKESLSVNLNEFKHKVSQDGQSAHDANLKYQTLSTRLQTHESGVSRMQAQLSSVTERYDALMKTQNDLSNPEVDLNEKLQSKLQGQVGIEEKLTEAQRKRTEYSQKLSECENALSDVQEERLVIKDKTDSLKVESKEFQVRCQTIVEHLEEESLKMTDVLNSLSDEANERQWSQNLDSVTNKIARLGPINLAAIDEYKTEAERMEYLKAQKTDLEEALGMLDTAIAKIDKETRAKFKETFEKVNEGFSKLFPILFAGGQAGLELTESNLLDAGVSVVARPPGKRNSKIHSLSGGEKALTAVALIFAIFQLNPSPFCMLDEVDAPLDDVNVGRFCELLEEMAKTIQFIFITHNKITMELAHQLTGVTMNEPGVSRMVSVDVEQALSMAEG